MGITDPKRRREVRPSGPIPKYKPSQTPPVITPVPEPAPRVPEKVPA